MEETIIWERGPFSIMVWGGPDYARWLVGYDQGNGGKSFIHQEGYRIEDIRYFREKKIGPITLGLQLAPEPPMWANAHEPTPYEFAYAIAMQYAEVLELIWITAGTMTLPQTLTGGFR